MPHLMVGGHIHGAFGGETTMSHCRARDVGGRCDEVPRGHNGKGGLRRSRGTRRAWGLQGTLYTGWTGLSGLTGRYGLLLKITPTIKEHVVS